jgi:hypothetical protein
MMHTRFSSRQPSKPFTGNNVCNIINRKKKLERSCLRIKQEEAFKEIQKLLVLMGAEYLMVKWIELSKPIKKLGAQVSLMLTCTID